MSTEDFKPILKMRIEDLKPVEISSIKESKEEGLPDYQNLICESCEVSKADLIIWVDKKHKYVCATCFKELVKIMQD